MILLSAQGKRFDQAVAQELAALDRMVLICGRYEGVDERVSEYLADREISIGDYVLSGGELGAAVIVDTVTRLIPGRGRERGIDAAGVVHGAMRALGEIGEAPSSTCGIGRIAGLSALHAARGVSRDGGAGSVGEWQP